MRDRSEPRNRFGTVCPISLSGLCPVSVRPEIGAFCLSVLSVTHISVTDGQYKARGQRTADTDKDKAQDGI